MRVRRPWGALSEREFRLLFVGQLTSAFGDRLAPIALAFAVLDLTGSAADLGYVLAAQTVPMLFLVALGGVWGDRLPRQLVMLAADALRCCSQGLVAGLLLTGHAHVWELAALNAAYGAGAAFFTPAMTGLIPATVRPDRLQQANALMRLSNSSIGLIGPGVGATLVALASPGVALAVDAGTFAVSALTLGAMNLPRRRRDLPRTSTLAELREGLREVRSRRWLWVMIVYFGVFNIAAFPAFLVLGPYVAKQSLGGASAWGVILTGGSIGAVLGGLLAIRARPRRPVWSGTAACAFRALPTALLALHGPVPLIAAALLLSSGGITWGDSLWHTVLQQRIPESAISRVSAIDWTGTLVLNPISYAIIGPLSGAIGIRATLYASALLTLGSTLFVLALPSVRAVRSDDSELEPALETA
jgi:MFS family permease